MKLLKKIGLPIILIPLFTACGLSDSNIYLDNPTDKPMEITLGGNAYTIAPHELKKIEGHSGKNILKDAGGKETELDIANASNILLNLNNETFIIWTEEFSTNSAAPSHNPENTIVLGDKTFKGPFEKREGLLINFQDIDYSFNEEIPKQIEITGNKTYVIKKKIYRVADFLADPVSQDYLVSGSE